MYYYFDMAYDSEWGQGGFDWQVHNFSCFYKDEQKMLDLVAYHLHKARVESAGAYNSWKLIVWDDNLSYSELIDIINSAPYDGIINKTGRDIDIMGKLEDKIFENEKSRILLIENNIKVKKQKELEEKIRQYLLLGKEIEEEKKKG